jgi:hypothetical protein
LIKIYRPGKVGNQNQMILAGQMEAPITDLLPNLSVVKTDLNGDKKPDYFIGGFVRDDKDEVQAVRFSYFAGNFQPLFPGSNSIDLDFDGVLLGPLTLNFVTLSTKDFGTIAYPTFWAVAGVPKADADPDPFNFEPTDVQMHRFYFYELQRSGTGAVSFKTRLFDNSAFYKNLRKNLGIAVVQDLALMDSLGQSNADASQGILRLVGSYGTGILQTYFQVKIQGSQILNHESQILKMSVPSSVDLQHQPFDDMIIYNSSNGTSDFGTSITGIFSLNQARVIALDDRTQSTSFLSSINVSPADPMGQFAPAGKVHIQTFEMDRQTVSFFEGEDHLIAQGTFQGKQFHTESQIYRSSFLAGPIFSQLFYPVLVSNSGSTSKKPGLFVDNSKLFSPTAQIWTLDENNQLSIPLSLNYALPENCQSMNPTRWSSQDVVVISCQSNGKLDKLMFMGL